MTDRRNTFATASVLTPPWVDRRQLFQENGARGHIPKSSRPSMWTGLGLGQLSSGLSQTAKIMQMSAFWPHQICRLPFNTI